MIYKLFSSWGPKYVPTRTRISDIAIFVGTYSMIYLHTLTHKNRWHTIIRQEGNHVDI